MNSGIQKVSFNGVVKTKASSELVSLMKSRVIPSVTQIEVKTYPESVHFLATGKESDKLVDFIGKYFKENLSPKDMLAKLNKLFGNPRDINLRFKSNIDYAINKLNKA